ncbi:MAG: ThiF family adenylyltransferase [Candidatus Heimdallarchaeota archaeon]|nr:ThiF family adenylyltransferase [Candidatus Heimdallarchaeota archaeon]MDH5646323.1 ThiF family adenylyltransferase [Candidatus Heimdallarchaeota archaeon]
MTTEKPSSNNFFAENISVQEKNRLDRQLRLPGWNQAALKDSSVIIVGVGGLGTEIAKNLAMAGVGTIHLVDMDTIEYSNLNRQILFLDAKEGSSKAEEAAKMLKRLNPHGKYIAYNMPLQEIDPQIYQDVDLYIAGLDSVNARREINRRAVHFMKPLIDGGTATYHGHVYCYIPKKNSCLACDPMIEREREDLAACTLVGIPRKKSHCLLKGQLYFESENGRLPSVNDVKEVKIVLDYANNLMKEHFSHEPIYTMDDVVDMIDQHEPAIITVNAVIASIQSQDALRILHHLKGTELGALPTKYTIYNGLFTNFFQFEKPKNPKCEVCSNKAIPLARLKTRKSNTFDMILRVLANNGYKYDKEMPPMIWRIDLKDMEMIELEDTLAELKVRNNETFLISGIQKQNKEDSHDDLYLRIRFND